MLSERIKEWPEKWKQEGIEEGEERHAVQVAHRMLEHGNMSDEMIADFAGLDIDRVVALRRKIGQ